MACGIRCYAACLRADTAVATFEFRVETPRLPALTLADADALVASALAVGAERGFAPLAVAVADVSGAEIVLRRGDGGMPMTSRIAVAKARTALMALQSRRA